VVFRVPELLQVVQPEVLEAMPLAMAQQTEVEVVVARLLIQVLQEMVVLEL
jgi:hypothetical protein